ncbi:MAG: hypothetical protein OEM63_00300 [Gammaproteobacteria bacterium]|nr:hypothetical protein [Gammaproteobacteria bacterium]
MGKKKVTVNDRARQMVAQEAARIIVEQGIQDFRVAKTKAADRLGLNDRGSLPGNSEIQAAVSEHHQLFGRESHFDLLQAFRRAALSAMEILSPFSPRLVGPVLNGTAVANSAINLHVFSDTPELIAMKLDENSLAWRSYERRLKSRRDRAETFAGYRFHHDDLAIEATVFPVDGMRQAPISPVDGRPMKRADSSAVRKLLEPSN